MPSAPHPLDPLTPDEITQAADIVRPLFPAQHLNFRVITLLEPPKDKLTTYLDAEHLGSAPPVLARCARVEVLVKSGPDSNDLFELVIDVQSKSVVKQQRLEGKHSYIDAAYMQDVERACIADARVQSEIAKLALPEGASVIVEAWAYATDGASDMARRITMCWFYARLVDHPDANYYAYPLSLCAEVEETLKVIGVYHLPCRAGETVHNDAQPFDARAKQPLEMSEYHPDLRPSPRTTTKPLQVVQPDGASFSITGQHVSWEKWQFRVGFNYREGLTLHDIRYDGRQVLHRVSLAEMFVPYADPRSPYPRKGAFDLGNDGAGVNANNLRLGCDCLGTIAYFDGWHNTASGLPLRLPNVVCVHEQDDGILWKHTNFRTGHAVVTRSRVLVLQTIITVSNYEYIFAFHFGQDASINYEVRATGILSTVPIAVGEPKPPYGTIVAPGVLAPYHQHLFCLRIDAAIDGHKNSVVIEESHAMPLDDAEVHNPFGIGYETRTRYVEREGGFDLDFTKNRVFKIVNETVINPTTQTPVSFKLLPSYSQMLLAHPSSFHARRSEYGQHAVWVTKYREDEMFPSGRYTMQSMGGEGIATAIKKRAGDEMEASVRNEDVVVWHTFGSTHNPRIEDWPVMPCEKMSVGLKPVNFFSGNPGLDVAPSTQEVNKSVLHKAIVDGDKVCCQTSEG
ncbi:copper amine oxidase [Boeremia exigua]|uniref:copper amine oxidase n=1 Tax=Boeremia exigua TaxID=749465 RepID=UPI001E8D46AF|nr:copper amine oxidase [Boeremia exigua]KAH6629136.1 copper amine oxidase [Boeremia exigua]